MSSETNKKVALSLIDEVDKAVQNYLGINLVWTDHPDNYDSEREIFCKKMIEQLDVAEKKAPNDNEVIFKSNFIKAQVYGCYQTPFGFGKQHKKAVKCYEKLLEIAREKGAQSSIVYMKYGIFATLTPVVDNKKAIEYLNKVIEIEGEDSEFGIECAKEIAKISEKKGGCFVATATLGSESMEEILILSEFRDNFLNKNFVGRSFIKSYYFISPYLVKFISTNNLLQKVSYLGIIYPASKLVDKLLPKINK